MERRRRALHLAILALLIGLTFSQDVDPCKRQPFRGRCPSGNGQQQRSQFVLRYYLRSGECVSYPFGHCANDENEPKLFRYKEECEDACLGNPPETVEASTSQTVSDDKTYSTPEIAEQTECQKQREQKGSSRIRGGFVPECLENGEFRQLQCEPDGETCFCVSKDGIEVPHSRNQAGQPKPNCEKIGQAHPQKTNECTGGADKGPCSGKITRFFYDESASTCKEFEYSGCGGSGNNYPTKESCEHRCAPNNVPDSQLCHRGQPYTNAGGQIVDCATTECPPGYKCSVGSRSVCCKDDQKNEADALHSGSVPQICTLPKERGPCDKYELRFYYNKELKECKYFFFGGCEGNSNNFESLEKCQNFCSVPTTQEVTKPSTTQTSTTNKPTETTVIAETARTLQTDILPTTLPEIEGDETIPQSETSHSEAPRLETSPTESSQLETSASSETSQTEIFKTETSQRETSQPESSQTEASQTEPSQVKTSHSETQPETSQSTTTPMQETTEVQTQTTTEKIPPTTTEGLERFPTKGPSDSTTEQQTVPEQQPSTVDQETTQEQITTERQTLQPQIDGIVEQSTSSPVVDGQTPTVSSESTEFEIPEAVSTRAPNTLPPVEAPVRVQPKQPETTRRPTAPSTSPTTTVPLPQNRCSHPLDTGSCAGRFDRWYWDEEKRICAQFVYTGCSGNGNNFGSREECLSICHVQVQPAPLATTPNLDNLDVCEAPVDSGDCKGSFVRYAFNVDSGACESFKYGGCGGNANNFGSMIECQRKCLDSEATTLPTNRCDHAIDIGDCTGSFKRFAYDQDSNECRSFVYSGCGGNGNNFGTNNECLAACAKVQCQPVAECDKSRCQLVEDAHGCPFCSCPPVVHPPPSFARPKLPPVPLHCAPINVDGCVEPCIIFTNRVGCQECVCPITPPARATLPPPASSENSPPFAPPGIQTPDVPPSFGRRPSPPSAPSSPGPASPPSGFQSKKPTPPVVETQRNVPIKQEEIPNPPKAEPFPTFDEKCTQHVDPGPCKNFVTRWHYNPVRGECEPFQYGGCAGNRNHFFSVQECTLHCGRFKPPTSTQPTVDQPRVPDRSVEVQQPTFSQSNEFRSVEVQQPTFFAPQPQEIPQRPEQQFRPPVQRPVFNAPAQPQEIPQRPEQSFRPPVVQQPTFNAPAPTQRFQEIPRVVPGEIHGLQEPSVPTLQPVNPRKNVPQFLPREIQTEPQVQPTQPPMVDTELPRIIDLPPQVEQPEFGREPERLNNRFQGEINNRKPEFNAPLSHNTQTASVAQARFEAQPLPPNAPVLIQQRPSLPTLLGASHPQQQQRQLFEVNGNVQQPQTRRPFEVSGNVQQDRQGFEVSGNVEGRQFIQIDQSAQRPVQQFVEVDRNVLQQQQQAQKTFPVTNEPFRRDPGPAPTPKLETQFVPRRLPEIVGEVERDAFERSDSPSSFAPNKQVKQLGNIENPYAAQPIQPPQIPQGQQQPNFIDNPYAARPSPPPPQQPNINDRYRPPNGAPRPLGPIVTQDINARYIPPNPALRPPEPFYPIPAPPQQQRHFDINSQYIPPQPMTVAPLNPNEPATTRAPLPKVLSQPHPNTYPPNLEEHYKGQRVSLKEPLPAPLPKIEAQFISKPPLRLSTPSTTTKKHPNEAEFTAIEDAPESVEKESNSEEETSVPPMASPLPKLPIKKIEKPNSVALPSEPKIILPPAAQPVEKVPLPVDEKESTTEEPKTTTTEKPQPHGIGLHSEPKSLPVLPGSESTQGTTQETTQEVSSTTEELKTTTTEKPQPHGIGLHSEPKLLPVLPGSESTQGTTQETKQEVSSTTKDLKTTTTKAQPHSIDLPAESKVKDDTQKLVELPNITTEKPKVVETANSIDGNKKQEVPEVEIKASGAKTQFVKHEEKLAQTKVDKTLPIVEVSKSTEETASSTAPISQSSSTTQSSTTTQSTTQSSTTTQSTTQSTTSKPTEASITQVSTKAIEQTYEAANRTVSDVTETPANDEDLLMSVDSKASSKFTEKHQTQSTVAVTPQQPRANSAQTALQSVSADQVNYVAETIQDEPAPPASQSNTYKATRLPKEPVKPLDEQLPLIGPSPRATIDYQTGKRFDNQPAVQAGIALHPNDKNNPVQQIKPLPEKPIADEIEERPSVPLCPNNFKPMHYSNGGPILCLPGKNQCPDNSVCYFNGIDFTCCPSSDDPYDQHVFGGYDGEELKHGYKSNNRSGSLKIKSVSSSANETPKVRKTRQALPPTSFSLDSVSNSLRFDGQPPPHRMTQAKFSRISPCTQPVSRGSCEGAMFRYFYDISTDECRSFVYSGCDGSINNFLAKKDCEQRCKIGQILTASTTTQRPTSVSPGHCPNGQAPLGDNAPVLCGNGTESIGCPPGYFCRVGPPDVCCPEDLNLGKVLAPTRGDIRRKPFVTPADKFTDGRKVPEISDSIFDNAESIDVSEPTSTTSAETTTKATTTIPPAFLVPANMCPDGSDSLPDRTCGSGFDGHPLCPRGFYCSIDRERKSRLCCKLEIQQSSNIPNPAPVIAPYLGSRRTNPGETIERGSLPSDNTPKTFGFRRKF